MKSNMFLVGRTKEIIRELVVLFCLGLSVFILNKCEKEKAVPRIYPRVNTFPVDEISKEGATFSGEIYSLGTENITEHGFVWGTSTVPTYDYNNKILLGPTEKTGEFKAEILTTLVKGTKYAVRAFVKTDEYIVYGQNLSFISLGSGAPQITGFEPESAKLGDTIIIHGKNFSWVSDENIVRLNATICTTAKSSDTVLLVIINTNLTDIKSKISVTIAGNISVYDKKEFTLIVPTISKIYPVDAIWGDTITITGGNLTFDIGNISATIGGFSSKIIGSKNDTLRVTVPYETTSLTNEVKIKIYNLNLIAPESLTLISPFISGILPKNGTWGNSISLTGRFNILTARNSVYFGTVQATITATTARVITVKIPNTLDLVNSTITYKVTPFTVNATDQFTLNPPEIKSFSPVSGPSGTNVIIKGNNFGGISPIVKFGGTSATVKSYNDSIITVQVPSGGFGPIKISVTKLETITSLGDFDVTIPKINSIYPLSGTFNDEITINGNNFIPSTDGTSVKFGEYQATIESVTATEIRALVPLSLDSIPNPIIITTGFTSLTYVDKFILLPHQIQSISPGQLQFGGDVSITGDNFNPDPTRDIVKWNGYSLNVKSASKNEIIATIPTSIAGGISRIEVETGGYIRKSDLAYEIKAQWTRIIPPAWFSADTYRPGLSFSSKGLGYMLGSGDGNMTSFNPSNNEFINLGTFPRFSKCYGAATLVNNDTLYIIGGSIGINRYDIDLNNWIYLGPAPISYMYGAAFTLNGKIYYGLTCNTADYSPIDKGFWRYDESGWVRLNDFPGNADWTQKAYFSINNKGYVILHDNKFWEYDPDSDTWTNLLPFPGFNVNRDYCNFFVISDKGYVGLGYGVSGGQAFDDLWVFDPTTKTWTQAPSIIGGGRYYSLGFSIGTKGYIGFGRSIYNEYYDILEFDPNFTGK
jgi:hypothetical protein